MMYRSLALAVLSISTLRPLADQPVTRQPGEEVNSPAFRERLHLTPNTNLLFNGLGLSPAGKHIRISDMPSKMVIAPDKKAVVAVSAGHNEEGINLVSLDDRHERQFIPLAEAFNGLVFSTDGKSFYVSGGDSGVIYVFHYANGKATLDKSISPAPGRTPAFLAGLALLPDGGLCVCNEANHEVWFLKPGSLELDTVVGVGEHPHSCVIGGDRRHLYVSNWGSRNVTVVDLKARRRLRDISVGIRPNDMALAPDGRLFVACSGDNTVHVIATGQLENAEPQANPSRRLAEGAREIISTSLYPSSPEGSTPCGLAVSLDGKTLFVANADQNSVMVADISGTQMEDAADHGEKISLVNGFIPVGWYPTAVAVTTDNKFLLVGNGKGLGSRASWPPQESDRTKKDHNGVRYDRPAAQLEGSISFIARPTSEQMAAYTEQVRRNSTYRPEYLRQSPIPSDSVIPARVGDPCPIKNVIFIIKENRTYDQVLGDLKDAAGNPLGNGEPRLTMYGEKVTPNQHALAREYVLFDNLFSNSEVSVDGHSWCDAAMVTDYTQRSWIMSYSRHGVIPGNSEMEIPAAGYLWDLCRRHGVTYKNYGEGSKRVPSANRGYWPAARDTERVKGWIADLKKAEQTGELPQFTIMSLGENHTKGTTPGAHTPEACVGNNDLALGQLVEAASHSKFWNQMAIFVIEDDTQNGPDHVDAHRTVGFVISPYCKRHFVDSTLYTTAGMVRTMELILGLPPLTQYDAGATPMFNCFQSTASATTWATLTPGVDLNAKNSTKTAFSKESKKMNFADYDLAPEDQLNRILWYTARPNDPYPTPIHRALFTTP